MRPLIVLTLRECYRRPFPYVAAIVMSFLTLASHLFQVFSFRAGAIESTNLALSSVFLAGVALAALVGTGIVRTDLERGTLGLLLTTPVGLPTYLAGRLLGLIAASLILCAAVAGTVALIFTLPVGPPTGEVLAAPLLTGWLRAVLAVIVLDAAALAISASVARIFGPVLFVAVLVAGSLGGTGVLPDLAVFGLEAGAGPPMGVLMLYTGVYATAFMLLAYTMLASQSPLRSQA